MRSLALQGGPMSPAECDAFEGRPHADAAVRLRAWDEAAKQPDQAAPPEAALALASLIRHVAG